MCAKSMHIVVDKHKEIVAVFARLIIYGWKLPIYSYLYSYEYNFEFKIADRPLYYSMLLAFQTLTIEPYSTSKCDRLMITGRH